MNKGGRGVRVGAWSRGPTWWGCDVGGARYDCGIKPTRPPAPGSHLQAEPAGTAPPYAVEPPRFRRRDQSAAGGAGCHGDIWRGGQPAILTLGYRAFCRLIDVVLLSARSAVQQNRDDGGGKTSQPPRLLRIHPARPASLPSSIARSAVLRPSLSGGGNRGWGWLRRAFAGSNVRRHVYSHHPVTS
jgi:hypothetical protein